MMRRQGYCTACVGKWHLGMNYRLKAGAMVQDVVIENHIDFAQPIDRGPLDFGFDYFYGSAGCSSSDPPYAYIENRHTVGIPDMQSPPEWNSQPGFYPGLVAPGWKVDEVDTTFTEKAVAFLDRHVAEHPEKPFFLHFCLNTPHIPWLAPEFIRGTSNEGPRGDMNALADWAVGQVYDALDRNGVLEDTLLIFTSDNGPQKGANGHRSAGPLRGFKNSAFEGGHRVPFIARWPGRIEPGRTSDHVFSLTDLMATFAELLAFDIPDNNAQDSMSSLPALLGEADAHPGHPMVNTTGGYWAGEADFALRKDDWKLIVTCAREESPQRDPAF